MITEQRKREAKQNFAQYIEDGMIKKEINLISKQMYLKNAELSLKLADDILQNPIKPFLWVIVISYYAMFYIANAILLHLGYKLGQKVVHKVTSDALIFLVLDKLKKELLESYEEIKQEALEIASIKAEGVINNFELELEKRAQFQYNMSDDVKQQKAETSLKRAKEFIFEMKKLIK